MPVGTEPPVNSCVYCTVMLTTLPAGSVTEIGPGASDGGPDSGVISPPVGTVINADSLAPGNVSL